MKLPAWEWPRAPLGTWLRAQPSDKEFKQAQHFLKNSRAFNMLLAMTSVGAKVNQDGLSENHIARFTLMSALYHQCLPT